MQNCFEVLEWNRVLEMVAKFSRTEIGKSLCLLLSPLEREELQKEMDCFQEANSAYYAAGRFPIDASPR